VDRSNVMKLFSVKFTNVRNKLDICPGQAYPAWSKVKNRAITYPSEALFRCSNAGWATGLTPTNIGLGWKGLLGTNTQAYYEH
jgi:hypothetical protein